MTLRDGVCCCAHQRRDRTVGALPVSKMRGTGSGLSEDRHAKGQLVLESFGTPQAILASNGPPTLRWRVKKGDVSTFSTFGGSLGVVHGGFLS